MRYPGGKARFVPLIRDLMRQSPSDYEVYVEPFAGGAGVALGLLAENCIERVVINDVDRRIAAFWRAITLDTEAFIARIYEIAIDMDSWHLQRSIMLEGSQDDLELGYAVFFMNRTNRSGILGARPIGGLMQAGTWKLDCRFDKDKMVQRIRRVAQYADRIEVRQEDAILLLDDSEFESDDVFVYLDPPYLQKSNGLYLDTLSWEGHRSLAEKLNQRESNWLLTYDCDNRVVEELYPDRRYGDLSLRHAAAATHVGKEYLVIADSLDLPVDSYVSGRRVNWIRCHSNLSGQSQVIDWGRTGAVHCGCTDLTSTIERRKDA